MKNPVSNSNFINSSYSNIIQNTDNSHINSVNYHNLISNNQNKNNFNNNPGFFNNEYNNSFEENNSISYNTPNNIVMKTPHFNPNGIVVNVKSSIQHQSNNFK